MFTSYRPTNRDLARPTSVLPRKVLRDIGTLLIEGPVGVGDWEIVGEELGFPEADLVFMRREPAAGADMLERWARRGPASTLYVLHTVLRSVDREDCLLLLERSIYTRVVCVNLMACIKHEDSLEINHVSAQVCADASLAESLAGVLETPLEEKFRLLDPGVTWTGSIAKDFKGRQLTILKLSKLTPMVQDPTVDSSVDIDNTVSARINLPMNYNHPRHFYLNIPYEDMGTSTNSRKHSLETNVSPIVKVPTSTSMAKKSFTNDNNSDPTVCYANMSSQREAEDTLHGKKRHPQVIFTNTVDSKQFSTSPMSECIQRPGSYAKDSKSGAKQTITMERNMQKNFDEICKKSDDEKYVDMRKSCSDCNGNCVHVSNENSYVKQIFRNPVACENQTDLNVRNISNLSKQNSANTNNSDGSDCCNSDEDKTMNSEEIINGIGEDDVFRREIVSEKQNVQDGEFVDTDMLCDSFDKCSAIGDDKGAVLNETVSEMMQSFGDGINVESPVNVTAETAGNLGENPVYQSDSSITYVKEYMFSQKENGTGLVNLNDRDKPTRCENKRKFYSCLSYTKVVHESYHEGNVSRFDEEELSDDSTTHLKTLFTSATHANEDITDQVEEHGEGMVNNCDISDKDEIPNYLDFNKFLQNSEESPTMDDLETRMDDSIINSVLTAVATNVETSSANIMEQKKPVCAQKPSKLKRSKPVPRIRYSKSEDSLNSSKKSGIENSVRMTAWQSSERLKPELENSPFSKPDSNESQSTRGISPKEMEPTNGDGHERTLLERTNTRDSSESRIRVCQPVPRRRNVCASNMQTAGPLFDGFRSVSFSSQSSSDLSGTESENLSSSLSGQNKSVNFSPQVEIVNSDPSARTEIQELTLHASFSSRSLDHLLEGDHVFGHYRAILAGYPGWCPMETDYTVPRTMTTALPCLGTYVIWYSRKKHCLVITISFSGRLIHYRIRMKVNNIGHQQDFSFFINKDLHFTNIIALLDYYQTQGLAVVDNENRTPGHQQLVPMATAVRVKYTTSV